MKRNLLIALLALALIVSLLPAGVSADEPTQLDFSGGDITITDDKPYIAGGDSGELLRVRGHRGREHLYRRSGGQLV